MIPKFKVGDEVVRISGGEWFGMREGDAGVVAKIGPRAAYGYAIRLEGFGGLFSEFRFKLRDEGGKPE